MNKTSVLLAASFLNPSDVSFGTRDSQICIPFEALRPGRTWLHFENGQYLHHSEFCFENPALSENHENQRFNEFIDNILKSHWVWPSFKLNADQKLAEITFPVCSTNVCGLNGGSFLRITSHPTPQKSLLNSTWSNKRVFFWLLKVETQQHSFFPIPNIGLILIVALVVAFVVSPFLSWEVDRIFSMALAEK